MADLEGFQKYKKFVEERHQNLCHELDELVAVISKVKANENSRLNDYELLVNKIRKSLDELRRALSSSDQPGWINSIDNVLNSWLANKENPKVCLSVVMSLFTMTTVLHVVAPGSSGPCTDFSRP